MKMRVSFYLALGLGLLLAACTQQPSQVREPVKIQAVPITAEHVPNQIVVGYFEESDLEAVLQALEGGRVKAKLPQLRAALLELPAGLDASHALGKLAGKGQLRLRYAQPNYTHPHPEPVQKLGSQALNDPLEAAKWDHQVMQAQAGWDTVVDAAAAPNDKPTGNGVVIAIVDTGIDGTHPDLSGQAWTTPPVPAGAKMVRGINAWTIAGNPGCSSTPAIIPPNFDATNGIDIHGTHVAGIAAARGNNGQGLAGVAYGAKLMDLKVFCGGSTDDFTLAVAVVFAIYDVDGDGVTPDVMNMSLGGKGYGQVFKDAIDAATSGYAIDGFGGISPAVTLPCYDGPDCTTAGDDGIPDRTVTIVAAMGNSGQDELSYPAGYPGIIAIGATDGQDQKASFSTMGGHISVGAPGVDILSTWPTWDLKANGQPYLYYRISGTSMATPQVAGAAALVKQFFPGYSAYQVRRILETTTDDIGPAGFDRGTGYGRINLKKLADKLAAIKAGTDTTDYRGGAARVDVATLNKFDSNGDGVVDSSDVAFPLNVVDVQLLQGGVVKYQAKTNYYCLTLACPVGDVRGAAFFNQIAPGTYDVLVAGQDNTDSAGFAFWPQERVSKPLATGVLTVTPGTSVASPPTYSATLDSTMTVELTWTGGGDLDLAVLEFNPDTDPGAPVVSDFQWRAVKAYAPDGVVAGGLWGTFSADSLNGSAPETYTLNATHYPTPASNYYLISINARNATVGTTAYLKITLNGVTKTSGPIPITPGSGVAANFSKIFAYISAANLGFDNIVAIY